MRNKYKRGGNISKLKIGSAFSGIGAWEKAFTSLNIEHELKWFIEFDKHASTSYSAIHNVSEELNKGDITEVNPKELDDIDVFVYSPPCQTFSIIGKQQGLKDPRGQLFYDALPIIQEKKPKYALMENVKGLTGKRFDSLFKDMLNELDLAGYNNYYQVLNAKNYGTPQNRERVFIVSIRKDIDNGGFQFPIPKPNEIKLVDILDKNVDDKYFLDINRFINDIDSGSMDKLKNEKLQNIIQLTYPKFSQQRLYSPYGISPTIPAGNRGGGKEPTKMLFIKDGVLKVRKLTPKECWRLMGFSDEDFDKARQSLINTYYNGNDRADSQLYKQAGNSVVTRVIEEIYKILFKEWLIY